MSLSRKRHWLRKLNLCLTRGSGTRDRSRQGSRRSWRKASLAKFRRSLKILKLYSRFCSRVSATLRVSLELVPRFRCYELTPSCRDRGFEGSIDSCSAMLSSQLPLSIEPTNASMTIYIFNSSHIRVTRRRPAPTYAGAVARSPIQVPEINSTYLLLDESTLCTRLLDGSTSKG